MSGACGAVCIPVGAAAAVGAADAGGDSCDGKGLSTVLATLCVAGSCVSPPARSAAASRAPAIYTLHIRRRALEAMPGRLVIRCDLSDAAVGRRAVPACCGSVPVTSTALCGARRP
jgi:hypothetical protein